MEFSEKVVKRVNSIPKGKVVTYGNISEFLSGNKKSSQAVGQAIKKQFELSADGFPWWRVVPRDWKPVKIKDKKTGICARSLLEDEGVTFTNKVVNEKNRYKLKND